MKIAIIVLSSLFGQFVFGQTRTLLIEKHSATWCGYCPAAALDLEDIEASNPLVIGMGIHYNDVMQINDGKTITDAFVEAFPGSTLDRFKFPTENKINVFYQNWGPLIEERLQMPSPINLSSAIQFDPTSRLVTIQIEGAIVSEISGDVRLNAFIIEDSVTGGSSYNQRNYYFNNDPSHELYQAGDPILNYVHQHVLREAVGGAWGINDNFANPLNPGETIATTLEYTIPAGFDLNQIHIIVTAAKHNANTEDREILNAQKVALPLASGLWEEDRKQPELGLFPNPAQDGFFVQLEGLEGAFEANYVDVAGKSVFTQQWQFKNGVEYVTQPPLPPGMYFITVRGAQKIFQSRIQLK